MPELPEVETMRRGIAPIVGGEIDALELPRGRCKPIEIAPSPLAFRRRILGQTIVDIDRRGKRVLVRLGSRDAIVFEPRMTGLVLLAAPPDPEHVRAVFQLRRSQASQLLFWDRRGLGSIRVLSPEEEQQQLGSPRLGPDALEISIDVLRTQFDGRSTAIKVALLDQSKLAGIGNLYASEILFVARIHPEVPCNQLAKPHWKKLHLAMQHVLREAIHYEGSTLSDGTYRNALNQTGSYQNHHRVYQRHGEMCTRCRKKPIQRFVQAQRATFFCPHCQSAPRP